MSEFDLNVSINNLSQLDRHQDDIHKTPIAHQEQNARKTEEELQQRMTMPVAPDEVEDKNVNPDDHRTAAENRKRKKRRQKKKTSPRKLNDRGGSEHIVDVTV